MNILNNLYLRFIFISTLVFLVSGCGGTWQHSYKSENAFYSDKNFCSDKANKAFPQARRASALEIAQLEPGRVSVYNAGQTGSYNANSFSKKRYAADCLRSKGWYLDENTKNIGGKNFNLTNGYLSWD